MTTDSNYSPRVIAFQALIMRDAPLLEVETKPFYIHLHRVPTSANVIAKLQCANEALVKLEPSGSHNHHLPMSLTDHCQSKLITQPCHLRHTDPF